MPLSAEIDGRKIISTFISIDEWLNLKKEVQSHKKKVIMPCCGARGHLKNNGKGTKFFAHNRGTSKDCLLRTETADHRLAKEIILLASRDSGFDAYPEYAKRNWRADVFAEKGDLKIAFEVQVSNQTSEITLDRQILRLNDGVKSCWFFKNIPQIPFYLKEKLEDLQIPMFKLIKCEETGFDVVLDGRRKPLSEFVKRYLAKLIAESSDLKKTDDPVDFVETTVEEEIPVHYNYSPNYDPGEDLKHLLGLLALTALPIIVAAILSTPKRIKRKWGILLLVSTTFWLIKRFKFLLTA
jgi:hypothetical protein